jgi:heme oxygenase
MIHDVTPSVLTLDKLEAAPTLSVRLRTETRAAHEAIEAALNLDASLASPQAYRDLLARVYAFHAGWEPVLAALIGDPVFLDPRRKLDLLAADLAHLGLTPAQISALAPRPPAPPLTTLSQAYGALYVLEGSTLGGQLISRQVAERLGFGPDDAAHYYNAYGRSVGARWRAFGQRLAEAAPDLDGDAVVAGARAAFAQLQACLTRSAVRRAP